MKRQRIQAKKDSALLSELESDGGGDLSETAEKRLMKELGIISKPARGASSTDSQPSSMTKCSRIRRRRGRSSRLACKSWQ